MSPYRMDRSEESRTVVVSGVPDVLPSARMTDKLTVHFQSRRRSHGGDVEVVRYPTDLHGVAFVTFDREEVSSLGNEVWFPWEPPEHFTLADESNAARVIQKDQQIMTDRKFPKDYPLTVFPFTTEVFYYVANATVDLSMFGSDQSSVLRSLQSAHRSVRFQHQPELRKATIEGPFSAVQALRENLISRTGRLQTLVLNQTASSRLRETLLNPRAVSHHELVGSLSCSGSKANLKAAGSNSLSTPLQSTGEAAKVQSLFSNANTQNSATRQKVYIDISGAGGFTCLDRYEKEEQGAQARSRPSPVITQDKTGSVKYRSERAKAEPRQVLGEISGRITFSLSGLDRFPTEEISAKQPGVNCISEKHSRPDRTSAAPTGSESLRGHCTTDYLKPSDKLLQIASSGTDAADRMELSAEDESTWVDSNVFKYIETFDKDEFDNCLKGLDASITCIEGSELTRILLTDKRTIGVTSRVQVALQRLKNLVELRQSNLRVHLINFDEKEQLDNYKVIEICDFWNAVFTDCLYTLEDSCIKVVGPSTSSHLFYKSLKDKVTKLKDTFP